MTVHGVSYGLDEQESFLAQVAGLYDAAPRVPGIRRVTIAECRPARARRLAAILDRLVREQSESTAAANGTTLETPTQIEAGAASLAKAHVFVAMPFSSEFEDTYVFGIQGPVNAAGFLCERIDMAVFTGDILNRIKERIETAALVIADLTGANLSNADLRDCQLGPLLLEGDRILPASLAGTRARYTDFRGADLRQLKATGADFSYAHLDGADVRRATFGGSCFTGTSVDERFLEQVASIEGAVDLDAA